MTTLARQSLPVESERARRDAVRWWLFGLVQWWLAERGYVPPDLMRDYMRSLSR